MKNNNSVLQNINLSGFIPISGIYKITNLITGKIYIGSSFDIYSRISQHVNRLINSEHGNSMLSDDVRLYGLRSFEVCIIEECEDSTHIKYKESKYIKDYKEKGFDLYNVVGCYDPDSIE